MKQLSRSIERDGSGSITLIPQDVEDMWHAFNIIQIGDQLKATTIRRVVAESNTGSVRSDRVKVTLQVTVDKIDFDSGAAQLHLNGRVVEENRFVKLGSFHTLDLEVERAFTVFKNEWDSIALSVVDTACNPESAAEVGAVVLHEGLAHVCLLTQHLTLMRERVEQSVPKKRLGSSSRHDRGMERFLDAIYKSILRNLNLDELKAVLIASPGFIGEQLREYIFTTATQQDLKSITKNKSKFLVVHSSTGHMHALNEVLKDPAVVSKLADTRFAKEAQYLEKFYQMLSHDENRAWYGPGHVKAAAAEGAISTLLISDSLFRSNDPKTRKEYVGLVERVKDSGAKCFILSSMHETGEQLRQIGGIAAILSYPLPELDI